MTLYQEQNSHTQGLSLGLKAPSIFMILLAIPLIL